MEDKFNLGSCDLRLHLRICGFGEPVMYASTDEGDGFTIGNEAIGDERGVIDNEIIDGWVNQLEEIVKHLKENKQ